MFVFENSANRVEIFSEMSRVVLQQEEESQVKRWFNLVSLARTKMKMMRHEI